MVFIEKASSVCWEVLSVLMALCTSAATSLWQPWASWAKVEDVLSLSVGPLKGGEV